MFLLSSYQYWDYPSPTLVSLLHRFAAFSRTIVRARSALSPPQAERTSCHCHPLPPLPLPLSPSARALFLLLSLSPPIFLPLWGCSDRRALAGRCKSAYMRRGLEVGFAALCGARTMLTEYWRLCVRAGAACCLDPATLPMHVSTYTPNRAHVIGPTYTFPLSSCEHRGTQMHARTHARTHARMHARMHASRLDTNLPWGKGKTCPRRCRRGR